MSECNKTESMENQKDVFLGMFTDSSDSEEEEYELYDHEYSVRSKGHVTCLSCGLQVVDMALFVSEEEGFESRVFIHKPSDELYTTVSDNFEDLIQKLSFFQITVENSLEKLSKMCETYMLPNDASARKGSRRHPFRISARLKGLCAALLWREALIHKLPLTMAGFSRKIGVPRTTILGAFKQLDDYSTFSAASKPGRPRKEP